MMQTQRRNAQPGLEVGPPDRKQRFVIYPLSFGGNRAPSFPLTDYKFCRPHNPRIKTHSALFLLDPAVDNLLRCDGGSAGH